MPNPTVVKSSKTYDDSATSRNLVTPKDYLTAIDKESSLSQIDLRLLGKLHEKDHPDLTTELRREAWIRQINRHNKQPRKVTDEEKREAINTLKGLKLKEQLRLKEMELREELSVEEMVKKFTDTYSGVFPLSD